MNEFDEKAARIAFKEIVQAVMDLPENVSILSFKVRRYDSLKETFTTVLVDLTRGSSLGIILIIKDDKEAT